MPIIVTSHRRHWMPRLWQAALYLLGTGAVIACLLSLSLGGPLLVTLANWLSSTKMETTLSVLPTKPVISITYQLVSLTQEPERHLLIRTPDGTLRTRLMSGWGPRMRASVYAVGNNQLALLDAGGGGAFVSLRPLQFVRAEGMLLASDQWTYLGAFDHYTERRPREAGGRREISRFINAVEQIECIPTYLQDDVGRGDRAPFTRLSCPEFGQIPADPIIGAPQPARAIPSAESPANPPR